MATDVDISINIKEHTKFNKQKALSLMSYLVEEKILTLKGDLAEMVGLMHKRSPTNLTIKNSIPV